MGNLITMPARPEQAAPPTPADWLIRHNQAIQQPRGIERAIVALRAGLLEYSLQYGESFEGCELGQDGFLGDAWLDAARAYLALLNGPTGRLDCGTLDGEVRQWAERCGFTEEV
jgi:hypothetical protein